MSEVIFRAILSSTSQKHRTMKRSYGFIILPMSIRALQGSANFERNKAKCAFASKKHLDVVVTGRLWELSKARNLWRVASAYTQIYTARCLIRKQEQGLHIRLSGHLRLHDCEHHYEDDLYWLLSALAQPANIISHDRLADLLYSTVDPTKLVGLRTGAVDRRSPHPPACTAQAS